MGRDAARILQFEPDAGAPTTVNQNMVTSGATMDSVPMIWRMLRPRDTLATYRPIIGA